LHLSVDVLVARYDNTIISSVTVADTQPELGLGALGVRNRNL